MSLAASDILPADGCAGTLVGRVWMDDGPYVVAVHEGGLFDLSALAPTISDLLDLDDAALAVRAHAGERLMSLDEVSGPGGFALDGEYGIDQISRDPLDLVAAACGPEHQYPDGFMLFLGAGYVPTVDRRGPGQGFTHEPGDVVRISSDKLGALVNRVTTSDRAPPWIFGVRALMRSLAARGLIQTKEN